MRAVGTPESDRTRSTDRLSRLNRHRHHSSRPANHHVHHHDQRPTTLDPL